MNFGDPKNFKDLATQGDLEAPALYQIFLHNDDFTPMEFVIGLLQSHFFMDRRKAGEVMLEAHIHGKALCGIFSRDFAEAKLSQVIEHARTNEQPLSCSMEAA